MEREGIPFCTHWERLLRECGFTEDVLQDLRWKAKYHDERCISLLFRMQREQELLLELPLQWGSLWRSLFSDISINIIVE